jgi:hypothetical protein
MTRRVSRRWTASSSTTSTRSAARWAGCPSTTSTRRSCPATRPSRYRSSQPSPRLQRNLPRPIGRPALVDPGRRGTTRPDLHRDPRLVHDGRVELRQHPVPRRLRRGGRHLRPRSAPLRAQALRCPRLQPAVSFALIADASHIPSAGDLLVGKSEIGDRAPAHTLAGNWP